MEDTRVASVCIHGYTSDKSKHIQTSYFINNPTQENKRLLIAHNVPALEHENYVKPVIKTIYVTQIVLTLRAAESKGYTQDYHLAGSCCVSCIIRRKLPTVVWRRGISLIAVLAVL